ncbi:monocarboxylate transporter 2-like [Babylonia areolata]|uniref:monocarboxylate transporter 2-like n=1 Tax=Babylonia areolata TaxID=304850 RepID=UPI003FD5B1C8
MPASTSGAEAVVATTSNTNNNYVDSHPLHQLSSDDTSNGLDLSYNLANNNNSSSSGGANNHHHSHSAHHAHHANSHVLLARGEGLASSGSSSSGSGITGSGYPRAAKRDMGVTDGKAAAMAVATGRLDLAQHFPDGGWGWVVVGAATCVHVLCSGFHCAFGNLYLHIQKEFNTADDVDIAWLGSLGIGISLFIAPFVTIICRRKSPRLFGVIGGLICALGCLFLAFSRQPEQLFISHCVVMSLGSGITIATASIMVGRYFKRRREIAESILVSGTGLGTALMSLLFQQLITTIKWTHGLQCMAGLLILTIIAGALYRSASLYHPRRKVILHLKSQKKNRRDREAEKPPYLDFSALRMRSLQALMVIAAIVGIGVHVPFVLLACTAKDPKVSDEQLLLLSVYLGVGFVAGCIALGYLTVRTSADCFICRRHLVQTAAVAGGALTLLLVLARDASAYSLYAWAYGAVAGAYYLGLKLYTLELVHQQLMERAWSFMSAVQCFPFLFGAPVASYLKTAYSSASAAYVFSGVTMVVGGLLFYAMPYFERHPSNHVILQKQSSVSSSNMTAEAAALLELDLTEGGATCKNANHAQCVMANRGPRNEGGRGSKDGDLGLTQGPGSSQHCKERERNGSKASMLSKIAEEKDGSRSCSAEAACGAASCSRGSNSLERRNRQQEGADLVADGPSDSTFSNTSKTDKSSGASSKTVDSSKKSKKNDVRIDYFDPPSQEKESTATVSYDSDLYINLCEAQV